MHIQIILGSVRDGRLAKPVGDWVYEQAASRPDCSIELVDLKEWDLPLLRLEKPPIIGDYEDSLQQRWAANVARADGYLFVCPEYNHGYSPALKNALDYLYDEWTRKPASFVTYGGVRGVEQLRLVLIELQMAPLRETMHIRSISRKLKDGAFVGDENDVSQLNAVLDELLWWGQALSRARRGE